MALDVLRQLVRALTWQLLAWASALRAAVDRTPQIDPELERLAERAFGELRQAPLVRPSRDIAESVKESLQRLQQETGDPPAPSTDERSGNQD
jgi:hypothetical protein